MYQSQDIKATYMSSTDEWVKKMWYGSMMEYYSAMKMKKTMQFEEM